MTVWLTTVVGAGGEDPIDDEMEGDEIILSDEDVAAAGLTPGSQAKRGRIIKGICRAPLSDQQTVQAEADKWAALWNVGTEYRDVMPRLPTVAFPRLTVEQLLAAAAKFKCNTGLGADNISPRALSRLSRPALDVSLSSSASLSISQSASI